MEYTQMKQEAGFIFLFSLFFFFTSAEEKPCNRFPKHSIDILYFSDPLSSVIVVILSLVAMLFYCLMDRFQLILYLNNFILQIWQSLHRHYSWCLHSLFGTFRTLDFFLSIYVVVYIFFGFFKKNLHLCTSLQH